VLELPSKRLPPSAPRRRLQSAALLPSLRAARHRARHGHARHAAASASQDRRSGTCFVPQALVSPLFGLARTTVVSPSPPSTRRDFRSGRIARPGLPPLYWFGGDPAPRTLSLGLRPTFTLGRCLRPEPQRFTTRCRAHSTSLPLHSSCTGAFSRVEKRRGRCRLGDSWCRRLSPSAGVSVRSMAPSPFPAHRTGRADFPHPALRLDFTRRLTRVRRGAAAEVAGPRVHRRSARPETARCRADVAPCVVA
jgi:hypothetical protein